MKVLDFTKFRNNASAVLDQVEEGKTIEISRHGKVIAKIVPADGSHRGPAWKAKGLHLAIRGVSLSEAIMAEREQE